MTEEDQRLRGGLPITAGVMIAAIRELCGAMWLESVEERARLEFAKRGVFGWKMLDTNVLLDVVPMPPPWIGEWGYRLKTANIAADGEVTVNEFYMPKSEIPLSLQRSRN